MSCCNNSYQGLPCCCPTGFDRTTTTTCPFGICCELSCEDGEICPEEYVTDCVIYNGDPVTLSCINILPGDTYTEILEAILSNLSLSCPTTTTTTTSSTTSTTSTTTTTTTLAPITTTTTSSIVTPVFLCLYETNDFGTCLYACLQAGSPSTECIPFYAASNCVGLGCNVYLDNALTVQAGPADDGVYSDGTHCYEITSGVITSYTLCSAATTESLFLVSISTSQPSQINSISGSWYSLPTPPPYSVSGLPGQNWLGGVTSSFSGNISIDVEITPLVNIYSLNLRIFSGQTLVTNTCLQIDASISGSQTITFTGVTINAGDDVEINLINSIC